MNRKIAENFFNEYFGDNGLKYLKILKKKWKQLRI